MNDSEKRSKNGFAQRAVWHNGGNYPADNFVRTYTLLPRSKFSVSRHCAKPLGRCAQPAKDRA